ncbi:MAG: hypothetical protein ACYTFI_21705, partial [Planctomycetota bacterium]
MQDSGNVREECIASVEELVVRIEEVCLKGFWLFRGLPAAYEPNLLPAAFRGQEPLRRSEERLV